MGQPRGDLERLMEHRGISMGEAEELLRIHPVEELLLPRGAGLLLGTAAGITLHSSSNLQSNDISIEEQLASCWDYISGCGIRLDNSVVWVRRHGVWLFYDSEDPGSEISEFIAGDEIHLRLSQACTLVYDDHTWTLFEGWNTIVWPGGGLSMGVILPIALGVGGALAFVAYIITRK